MDTAAVPKVESACTVSDDQESPEIGLDPAKTDIQAVQKDLEVNPPQLMCRRRFVYSTPRIQYVDFNFTGYQLTKGSHDPADLARSG